MKTRMLSVAVILLAGYLAFGDTFRHSLHTSPDSFVNGVFSSFSGAVQGFTDTVGRVFAWG